MPYTTLLFLIFSFIFAPQALAQEENFGLAMHGAPKHTSQDTQLSYVNPNAPKGGHLKMSATGSFDTINPYSLKGTAAQGLNLIYDRLMARRWDEPFTLYPLIAEKVAIPEDRSSITITINPKARFQAKTPITTEDILFSFGTLRDHGRPNMRRIYKIVEHAKIIAPRTIKFSLKENHDRETVMIIAMMPILSKKDWEEQDFNATALKPRNTNGPYRIESMGAGRYITYTRNPDYWAKDLLANKGHYNFDKITYEYFRDDSIALESFNKGDLNFRRESDISKWRNAYKDAQSIIKYNAPHQRPEKARGFIFNTRRAPFDDLNIRKALSLAFDQEWIGKNIYYGEEYRTKGYFPNSPLAAPQAKEEKMSLRLRLRTAATLLKDSGWLIENGQRIKNGAPLSFELILNAPKEEKIALNFKQQLKRLGITLNIRILDSAAFQKRRQDYDYDMILHHWHNSLSPGTEQMLYWSCESANQSGRFNFAGLCNKNIEATAQAIANSKDYAQLTALTHKLDRALQEQTLMIPLFHSGTDHIAHHSALSHPETPPLYGSVIETWWMNGNNQHKQD